MLKEKECAFCGTQARYQSGYQKVLEFYECPVCGRYEISAEVLGAELDVNKTASYLLYNAFMRDSYPTEYRYHSTQNKEICDTYKAEFEAGKIQYGGCVRIMV